MTVTAAKYGSDCHCSQIIEVTVTLGWDMKYFLKTLPNGVRVITVPMTERESAAVAIWVKAGARHESQKLSGTSHFLEHLLFKGTAKRNARRIKQEIEGVGGVLNAFTGEESTCYFSKLLVRHFPKALDVLSDMVNHATLPPKELEKERTVILEEIKMYKDLPSHHVHDLMSELLWPDHPLGRPIAGTEETVGGLSREEIIGYKHQFYHPKNIVVSVSGSIDTEEVMEKVGKYFPQKSSLRPSVMTPVTHHQTSPRTRFLEKASEQTHFVISLRAISRFHPKRYHLGLLNVILGSNMSSRLFEEVREKRGLAYEIRSGTSFYHDTGLLSISAGVEKSKAPMAVDVILRELEKMSRTPVTAGELRRAKDFFMSQLYMAIEDTLEHLLWVGERVLDSGEPPDHDKIKRSIEAVTAEDIREMARRIFVNKGLNFALVGPVPPKIQSVIAKDFNLKES